MQRGRRRVDQLDRRAEHAQRGVALELVDQPAVALDLVTTTSKNRFSIPTNSVGSMRRVSAVEPVMSTNSATTSRVSPPTASRRCAAPRRRRPGPTCRPNRSWTRSRSRSPATMSLMPAAAGRSRRRRPPSTGPSRSPRPTRVHGVDHRAQRLAERAGQQDVGEHADGQRQQDRERVAPPAAGCCRDAVRISMMPRSGTALVSSQYSSSRERTRSVGRSPGGFTRIAISSERLRARAPAGT